MFQRGARVSAVTPLTLFPFCSMTNGSVAETTATVAVGTATWRGGGSRAGIAEVPGALACAANGGVGRVVRGQAKMVRPAIRRAAATIQSSDDLTDLPGP